MNLNRPNKIFDQVSITYIRVCRNLNVRLCTSTIEKRYELRTGIYHHVESKTKISNVEYAQNTFSGCVTKA